MLRGTWAIVPVVFAGCLGASTIAPSRAEFRASYALASNGRVAIHNLYGDVEITAWDRDEVLVAATRHGGATADDARVVVDSAGGLLSIRTLYGGADAEHPASVEYHIKVPRRAMLEQVLLGNGGLSLNGLAGRVRASSVNGSIHAEKLAGEADLSTINGRLEADFERVCRGQAISLKSVNGPIQLSLPADAAASVRASNRSGGIQAAMGRARRSADGHWLEATVNGGGAAIRVDNVNGGISIRPAWSGRPVS